MTHQYQVAGITCDSCVAKVKTVLEKMPGVTAAVVGLDGKVQVTMSHHIATAELQAALRDYPKYQLVDNITALPAEKLPEGEVERSFLETYKPV
jgi:copper chaperone CopZ